MKYDKGSLCKKAPIRKCSECIHENACAMWNIGSIHNTNANACANYETVKMSAAYFIGKMDGEKARECDVGG